jgi:hypothetical protein
VAAQERCGRAVFAIISANKGARVENFMEENGKLI